MGLDGRLVMDEMGPPCKRGAWRMDVIDLDKVFPLDCEFPDCVMVLSKYAPGASVHNHDGKFVVIYGAVDDGQPRDN